MQSLADLARQIAEPGSPLDALDGLRELRRRLAALEEAYVEEALRCGATWETIGSALGVSRQAAHRRLSARVTTAGSGRASRS